MPRSLKLWPLLLSLWACGGGEFQIGDPNADAAPEPAAESGAFVPYAMRPPSPLDSSAGSEASSGSVDGNLGATAADRLEPLEAADSSSTLRDSSVEDAGEPGDGCSWTTHFNGLGGTWQDCAPLGTMTDAEALAACKSHGACPGSCGCNGQALPCSTGLVAYVWAPGGAVSSFDSSGACVRVGTWH
jgi:hypothetical protein